MEDKNLILQAKWDVVEGSCEVKKFIMVFVWVFFFPFGSYLDWPLPQPKRTWLAQILASLQGTINCQEELGGGLEDAELQDSLQSSLDRSVSHYS